MLCGRVSLFKINIKNTNWVYLWFFVNYISVHIQYISR